MCKRVCIFGTHHEFQLDTPMDSNFNTLLRELIGVHKVDTMLEEASGLPPKSCIELLADEVGIRWANMDLTAEERKHIPDSALTSIYDTLQDITMHSVRESAWVAKTSDLVNNSGLLIVGVYHVQSLGEKLRRVGYEVEAHVYSPNRIFNWSAPRPRVVVKTGLK